MQLNIFTLNRIKVTELVRDTVDFLVDKFNQSKKVFNVSSVYGQILYVLENLSQLMFYYIEDSSTELSIREATRDSSVYGLAGLAGYRPVRSIAASGQISIQPKISITETIVGNVVVIPNYLQLKCLNNNINYIVELTQDEFRIDITNNNKIYLNVIQGRIETQILSGYGTPYASYSMNFPKNYHIDNNWVKVYVNDVLQPIYKNLLKIPAGSPGCMITTGITSGIDIFFGNGKYGNYPGQGAIIRIECLITDGYGGNVKAESIDDVYWEFVDTAFDEIGNEINLNEIFNISTVVKPSFGSNPESVDLTRMMLSKTNDILMIESDYELLLRRMQTFSIVRVYRDDYDDRMLNLFLVPDISKLLSDSVDYFSIPESSFILTKSNKNDLLAYIEKMGTKTIATDIKIIDPIISRYVLYIDLVIFSDVDEDLIKRDVISTISEYFTNTSRKKRIPRSDLIKNIENINGVDSVNIKIVSEKYENYVKNGLKSLNQYNGIDPKMNDIYIEKNELAIIRGGWTDRNGTLYNTTYSTNGKHGAVNINIIDVINK